MDEIESAEEFDAFQGAVGEDFDGDFGVIGR